METEKRVGMKEMFPAGVPMLERSHDPSTSLGMTPGRVGMKEMFAAGVPMFERSHDPSTTWPALTNRAQEKTGHSARSRRTIRNAQNANDSGGG